jgi:endoglucanase
MTHRRKQPAESLPVSTALKRAARAIPAACCLGTSAVLVSLLAAQGPSSVPAVRVDQAGYLPEAPKVAILAAAADGPASARVVRSGSGEVTTVPLGPARLDEQTNDTVRTIDLSTLTQPGTYVISVEGAGQSDPVHVQPDVYRLPLYLTARGFYGLRCGTAVDLGPKAPTYRHAACHLEDATFHRSSGRSGRRPATKGWHDAGDYGKYIVNSGITTGQLLWAWEWYPDVFRKLRLDIPESENAVPDLLDEVRWNLEWMLAMQDDDGGVWHKLTSEKFGSFKMPEHDDGLPRYVIGTGAAPFKSSCATADFAAVMAIAARNWLDFDRPFATTTLDAARRAWTWVSKHPEVAFRNPPGVVTGQYGDANCADERLWAAAELLRTTGEAEYETAARNLAASFTVRPFPPESWANVGTMGLWSYAFAERADPGLQTRIRTEAIEAARQVAERTRGAGWRHGLTVDDFQWGSNGVAANYGVLLLVASRWAPEPQFREAALDHLHYLLGRNTFGLSWLTGVGVRPYRNPHHRPSGADQNADPWPGLLSGGPNRNGGDPVLDKLPATPPGRRYEDHQASYAGNEIAINWQASLVFLLAGVQP